MRVPVTVTPETTEQPGPCPSCGSGGETPRHRLSVFLGEGFGTTEYMCTDCFCDSEQFVEVDMPDPPKGGPPSKRTKKRSQQQERELAVAIGGRVQPGSGATPGAKGDVRKRGKLRVEAKMTYANSYPLTLSTLHKIRGECTGMEKSALVVSFMEKGTERQREAYAVVPLEDWEDLINAPRNNR